MIDAVAFHEAGHAVIALAVGLGVERASADPADPGVTTTVPADLPPGKRDYLGGVARNFVDLAGAAAEERAFGTADDEAQRPDEENALRRAAAAASAGTRHRRPSARRRRARNVRKARGCFSADGREVGGGKLASNRGSRRGTRRRRRAAVGRRNRRADRDRILDFQKSSREIKEGAPAWNFRRFPL